MNKKFLILGLLGVGAYLLYRKSNESVQNGVVATGNPNLLTQPGQQYPFKAVSAPRADNESEPWYGGSRGFQSNPSQSPGSIFGLNLDFQNLAKDLGNVSSISDSLQNLWSDLDIGNWFGGDSSDFDVAFWGDDSIDTSDAFSWGSFDSSFGGDGGGDYFASIA